MLWLSTITTGVLGPACRCGAHTMLQKGWAGAAASQARRPFHLVEPHMGHGRDQQEPAALPSSPILCSADREGESAMLPTPHLQTFTLTWLPEPFRFWGEETSGGL